VHFNHDRLRLRTSTNLDCAPRPTSTAHLDQPRLDTSTNLDWTPRPTSTGHLRQSNCLRLCTFTNPDCEPRFSVAMDLTHQHLSSAGPKISFDCRCGHTLYSVLNLVAHMIENHEAGRPIYFKCCGESFNTHNPVWLSHLKEHHACGQNPLPCIYEDCKQSFPKLDPLRKHIKSRHSEEVQYFAKPPTPLAQATFL
jgi:hypothetical protein